MKKLTAVLLLILFAAFPLLSVCAEGVAEIALPLEKGDAGVGVVIVQNRLKQLGYLHFSPTGRYGDMTVSALKAFQRRNELSATGISDEDTVLALFSEDTVRGGRNGFISAVHGKGQIATVAPGELQDWVKTVNEAFPVGDTVTVTDYNTGVEFKVKRTGGKNHADVTPLDKNAFVDNFGGSSTWEKRACIVTIGDMRIAASLFGNPNGSGEYCMYFSGSTSDVSGLPDAEHRDMLLKANGQ